MDNYSKIEKLQNLMHPKTVELKKVKKPGIVYLSAPPFKMNVKLIREYFSRFGKIGRIFLQPEKTAGKVSKKFCNKFSEGWVEFEKKSVAKQVALNLTNQPVGGKKGTPYHDALWNIKYLPGEQLAYEKATQEQRLRAEIAQAKSKTNHYVQNVSKSMRSQQDGSKKPIQVFQQSQPFNSSTQQTSSRDELLLSVFGKTEASSSSEVPAQEVSKQNAIDMK